LLIACVDPDLRPRLTLTHC